MPLITGLDIENFRCFEKFELHDLGRVNLLVGGNNSGKTSVLEAIELLSANGDLSSLMRVQLRRSEEFEDRSARDLTRRYIDIRRLFRGHSLVPGAKFNLAALTDNRPLGMAAEVFLDGKQATDLLVDATEEDESPTRLVALSWVPNPHGAVAVAVSQKSGVSTKTLRSSLSTEPSSGRSGSTFLSAASLTPDEAIELYSSVNMRPQRERFVYEVVWIIAPDIVRIGIEYERLRAGAFRGLRGGFSVLLQGDTEPVPIGSMGEGIWRLLSLSLCLARAENGILLVDEIDTGLHYSVMEKMWKLVTETAKRLNIQVFATTHSRDCVESLAAVCHEDVTANSEVTIQRIERGKKRSVAFSEREIVIAANRGIEVR